jgi:hypothetical protein
MEEFFDQKGESGDPHPGRSDRCMGLLSLILALVGLFGLMTYAVGLREREIRVRMAVGAKRRSVVWIVLRQRVVLGLTELPSPGSGVGWRVSRRQSSSARDEMFLSPRSSRPACWP